MCKSTSTSNTCCNGSSCDISCGNKPLHTTSQVDSPEQLESSNNNSHNDGSSATDAPRMMAPPSTSSKTTAARHGDIVTIDVDMVPENDYVPEGLFDTSGRISFVLGEGNYLPALHELVKGLQVGSSLTKVSIDAGFGHHDPNLVIEVPFQNLFKTVLNHDVKKRRQVKPQQILHLKGGFQVTVVKVIEDDEDEDENTGKIVVVDANHPLAGSSYSCSLQVVSIHSKPRHATVETETSPSSPSSPSPFFKVATVALGCFWGGELAMMRVKGVVGTKCGYTQGHVEHPTYEQVCEGRTNHREAIQVIYDTRVCSYGQILNVYFERLAATLLLSTSSSSSYDSSSGDDSDKGDVRTNETMPPSLKSMQYQHGIYYHDEEQRQVAENFLSLTGEYNRYTQKYNIELKEAAPFYDAEERHQQYLYKGGQSSRKGARDIIRCYG
mmetsp:Transcript_19729/g.47645  ORF Transcript_19729/g.47645 Transcript_19729/m.47645 type:complete len:439 (-) Transcript_19729:204-1520(-)|eukprot:CAMPEP_0113454718 /NCGR_PEP_ID=MMETSP0014_2-20120614/8008_1 /TAXON_ID=2857 /ORGANISM="Nitzschia sp." /LENGTH=438 /DNA_ID=CAMNT_0000346133 /DNA_START=283 /DNA_END=1599 /DNA_ORIENTATION=+ /assembly_acc=CAM_ASM_000159